MRFDETKTYVGRVIFRSKTYGFIEVEELGNSYFFHNSSLTSGTDNIVIFLDKVSCKLGIQKFGKHRGKVCAVSVTLFAKGNPSDFMRIIDEVSYSGGKYGVVHSPRLDKPVKVFATRLIKGSRELENGMLVVVSPVKDLRNIHYYFAFFAYPLEYEEDHRFLLEEYQKSNDTRVSKFIQSLNEKKVLLTPREVFFLKAQRHANENDIFKTVSIKNILLKLRKEYGYSPSYDDLVDVVDDKIALQLFLQNATDYYKYDIVEQFFLNAAADQKRYIAGKLAEQDRKKLAEKYFDNIQERKSLQTVSNEIKTFLDIYFRDESTRNLEMYSRVRKELLRNIHFGEILALWVNDYIEIDDSYVSSQLDVKDVKVVELLLRKGKDKYLDIILQKFEIDLRKYENHSESVFDINLYKSIQQVKSVSLTLYHEFVPRVNKFLSVDDRFILWLLNGDVDFNAVEYLKNKKEEVNPYFKLRAVIKDKKLHDLLGVIVTNDIIDGIKHLNWEELIFPTGIIPMEKDPNFYFLPDCEKYNSIVGSPSLDIYKIADALFQYFPKYVVHHIRIWLYGYLDDQFFDYVGYRSVFKKLTIEEQKLFWKKALVNLNIDLENNTTNQVKPCDNFEFISPDVKIYKARIENIYFQEGSIQLRLENGQFTKSYMLVYSSRGLNNIPESHELNRIIVELEVSGDHIVSENGLEIIISKIYRREIDIALGKVSTTKVAAQVKAPVNYTEDMLLRKRIVEFLNGEQSAENEVIYVDEPKNHYRRLDETTDIDAYEKVGLFTIDLQKDKAIIWENIDFSLDRATYIFKASVEEYPILVERIKNAIAGYAQFRSTLISKKIVDEKLEIFKNSFGFVKSIRKNRGKKEAFTNWKRNLLTAIGLPTPVLPADEEVEKLNDWSPEIYHASPGPGRVKPSTHRIPDKDIVVRIMPEIVPEKIDYQTKHLQKMTRIHTGLKSLNEKILKFLNS